MQSDDEILNLLSKSQTPPEQVKSLFQIFYQRHSNKVLNYALKKLGHREQAEEALQIIFWKLFSKRHLFDSKHPAMAWLFVISRSEIRDFRRKENRHPKTSEGQERILSQIPDSAPIQSAIEPPWDQIAGWELLNPQEQELIKARYVDDLSFDEIAEKWGDTSPALRKKLSRLLKFLRGLK